MRFRSIILGLIWLGLVTEIMAADQVGKLSEQTAYTSAYEATFGRMTPARSGAIGSYMINPASLGGISYVQFLATTFQVSKQFQYRHASVALPWNGLVFGVSYGTNMADGFIETIKDRGVIYNVGEFSSGFDTVYLGVGGQLFDGFLFIDGLYYGVGVSGLSQVIGSSRRSPAIGVDAGVIATFYMNGPINQVDLGASALGLYSTGLPEWSPREDLPTSNAQDIPREFFVGATVSMLDDTMTWHVGSHFQDVEWMGGMAGLNYTLFRYLGLRVGATYDPLEKYIVYNLGSGLRLPRVAGLGRHVYGMSLDYAYTLYTGVRLKEPAHTISLTFLGQSSDLRPRVRQPSSSFKTSNTAVDFNGVASKYATVYAYLNDRLVGEVKAGGNGRWSFDSLPILPGYNAMTFRSRSRDNDTSPPSDPIVVHLDVTPPVLDVDLSVENGQLVVTVTSDEDLKSIDLLVGDDAIPLRRSMGDSRYVVRHDLPSELTDGAFLPNQMTTIGIRATDDMGNTQESDSISLFIDPIFPLDKTVVYSQSLMALGHVSSHVTQLRVNGTVATIDANRGFSVSVPLEDGRQRLATELTLSSGQVITYYTRLLSLRRFDDIPDDADYRNDIELLATLGYAFPRQDGRFYPESTMTRRDVIRSMVQYLNIPLNEGQLRRFSDVSNIDPDRAAFSAAVDRGILPATTRAIRPDQSVTVAQAFKMLVAADIIPSSNPVLSDAPIKRYVFAQLFKRVPGYDQQVQDLLNWDQ